MSSLPNDPVPLYDFNPGTKTWKIHAHKISSIAGGNLVLQAAGENSEIYFAQKNNEVYKISDLLGSDYVTVNSSPGSISIGQHTMSTNAGTNGNIAIGHYASQTNSHNSGTYRIAIGYEAGKINQGGKSISIGYKAGENNQAANSIILNASGNTLNAASTGFFVKPIRNVASGTGDKLCYDSATGEITYQPDSGGGGSINHVTVSDSPGPISIGQYAMSTNAGTDGNIAIGHYASQTNSHNSGTYRIAIGYYAGNSQQYRYSLAIGYEAAKLSQSEYCVAIGYQAGYENHATNTIAIGKTAGKTNQRIGSVAIGLATGLTNLGQYSVAIGHGAGNHNTTASLGETVAIGNKAAEINQGNYALAIGRHAARTNQGYLGIAIGNYSGNSSQGPSAIAIGPSAGETNQGGYNVAIGFETMKNGNINYEHSIAIGSYAGKTNQHSESIGIGYKAGHANQNVHCVAIGRSAGENNQGIHSVALGSYAGQTDQAANSIILNAQQYTALNASNSGFYVKPIRDIASSTSHKLVYDTGTGEISYQPDSGGGGSINNLTIGDSAGGSILIGYKAGQFWPGGRSVFIGEEAGWNTGWSEGVMIGYRAGYTSAGYRSVGIGPLAASNGQGNHSVYIGDEAGATGNEKSYVIGIGFRAGHLWQDEYSVSIGPYAGFNYQSLRSVAIGLNAGRANQGAYCVAIGNEAGKTDQAANSIVLNAQSAIALDAPNTGFFVKPIRDNASSTGHKLVYDNGTGEISYQPDSGGGGGSINHVTVSDDPGPISIGQYAMTTNAGTDRNIAIGHYASHSNSHNTGTYRIAIGYRAGKTNQYGNSIAIGKDAGITEQKTASVAIGLASGATYLGSNSVAIGYLAGNLNYSNSNGGVVAIGDQAAEQYQGDYAVAIGRHAARTNQGYLGIAIGNYSGNSSQGEYSIAIGASAGQSSQASNTIAIGTDAGKTSQRMASVAIGKASGLANLGPFSVAIGHGAGNNNNTSSLGKTVAIGNKAAEQFQGNYAVAIGTEAARWYQGNVSIAIGNYSGNSGQGNNSIAIGASAGQVNQGDYCIALGDLAGQNNQAGNSIVLNAQTNVALETANTGFFVKPIRNVASGTGDKLCYDSATGEITYQPDSGGGGGGGGGSTAIDIPIPAVNYDFRDAQVSGNKITWPNSYGSGHHAILGGSGANLVDSSPDHVLGTSTSWVSLHGALSIINNPCWSFEMYIKKNSGTQPGGYLTFGPLNASSSDFDPTFSLEIQSGSTNITAWWGTSTSYFEPNRLHIPELVDQWTHWVVTYNGTSIKLYRNYSTSTTHDTTSGVPIPYYGFEQIKIGRTAWTEYDLVSEETRFVRFYSKALTDDEVNKLYLNRDTEGPINSIYEAATTNPDTELKLRYPYKISELQGTSYNSKFGLASSMNSDGTRMAVGVPGSNLVKVYDWDGSTWNQIGADLTFSSLVATEFGSDLEMNNTGNVVIVGDGSAYGNRGAVAIYEWNGSSWSQRGGDIISPFNGNGYFGRSVSISDDGSIIAVGCHNENMHGYYYSGRVYIYQWNGSAWNAYGDSPTQAGGNGSHSSVWGFGKFGGVVKLAGDGNSFITGQEAGNNGSGKLWLFELQNGTWTTINITYPSYQTGWQEGFAKAVSGSSDLSIIAVTVGGQNLHFHRSGSVYMLKRSGNDYVPYGSNYIIEGEGGQNDFFGGSTGPSYKNNLSLSSDGKTVAISSVYNEANYTASNSNVGQVKVYKYNEGYNGGTWSLLFKTLFGKNVSDYFGYLDLTPDGLRLSVGAPQINSSNGYLCVYDLTEYTTSKLSRNAGSIGVGNDVDLTMHESSHYTNDEIENKSSDELKYGTQGQYLVSGGPSNPMKWISKPYASFVRPWNAPQFTIVANSAWTEINWTQVKFSSGIYLDSGGYHFRVIRSGAYNISVQCRFGGGDRWTGLVLLDKDEDHVGRGIIAQSAAFGTTHLQSDLVHLNILAEINETQHCVLAFYRQDGDMNIINTIPNNKVGHQMVCNITCVS